MSKVLPEMRKPATQNLGPIQSLFGATETLYDTEEPGDPKMLGFSIVNVARYRRCIYGTSLLKVDPLYVPQMGDQNLKTFWAH